MDNNTIRTFFISVVFLILLKSKKAREILRKAGSTNFINFAGITLRIIPAVELFLTPDKSKFSDMSKTFRWFMFCTSLMLYFVPRQLHHNFSNKAAEILKPFYFQLISPFSMANGIC